MDLDQLNLELDILFNKYKIIQPIIRIVGTTKLETIVNYTSFLLENATISERIYWIRNKNVNRSCKICGCKTKFINFNKGYTTYCSKECISKDVDFINKKIKATLLKNYGVTSALKSEQIKQKVKLTNLERYGVDCPSKNKDIYSKIKQTNLKKYGFECASKSPIIKDKIKQTNLEKYGTDRPTQNEDIKYKLKKWNLDKAYKNLFNSDRLKEKVIPLFSLTEYKGILEKHTFKCTICTTIFDDTLRDGTIPRCPTCYPLCGTSKLEIDIYNWCNSLDIKVINNSKKIIYPLELDMYIPDYNLAIEFNGLYYHSELSGNKDKNYHLNKTKMCEEKGIQLIHIFEDEWIDKQEIVKSIIKNKLGLVDTKIYARKCEIKNVSQEDAQSFLFENHLQEPIYAKYKFGLYYNNELVYLICLSKPRFNKKYQVELIRSCSKINTQVIGGFDRLVKHAIKVLDIKSLISYVDRRYFNGSGYKNNWQFIKEIIPNYHYSDTYKVKRESRIKYQKHKLKKLFPEYYDANLTEWQIMQLAGYDRIWDCGNLLFEYKGL